MLMPIEVDEQEFTMESLTAEFEGIRTRFKDILRREAERERLKEKERERALPAVGQQGKGVPDAASVQSSVMRRRLLMFLFYLLKTECRQQSRQN
jgi:hypothetical protein